MSVLNIRMRHKKCLTVFLALLMLMPVHTGCASEAEKGLDNTEVWQIYESEEYLILDDETYQSWLDGNPVIYPTVTSVNRENVKVNGVKSDKQLLEYTIPDELMQNDRIFAALMLEANKYIGYPFVYGASNPNEGFDCSGFVCWVFIRSGVYNTGRRGATGLHTLCNEIEPEDLRPGDLVFFHGTMGPDVKGITHVGIYVGNQMMIHAGDPVGFADLEDEKWQKCFECYGRLPYREESNE